MSAKVEKKIRFHVSAETDSLFFFPVCSFLPENTSLSVLQTKSATVTL